jgi:uncharacterized OB-fold protein
MKIDTGNRERPLPIINDWDKGYWEAAAQHRLVVQACATCGEVRSFPRLMCAECGSFEIEWLPASGRGTIYSWTVARRSFHPHFAELPIAIAVVSLEDYPTVHLVANIANIPREVLDDPERCKATLKTGSLVECVFEDFGETTLPQFRLA